MAIRPQQPDAVTVVGIHYSHTKGIARLAGGMYGRGIKGAERDRLAQPGVDPRLRRRIHLYAQRGPRLPTPEEGVGSQVYRAKLTNLYDANTRTITAESASEMERKIIDAGYDGYFVTVGGRGFVVLLDVNAPVEGIGSPPVASNVLLGDYTADIDRKANQAATSPQNDLPEPTEAQKRAGNYAKGHATVAGIPVTIENPAGSERTWKAPDGTTGKTVMRAHYGYIKRTEGADGEPVDVFIRPGTPPDWAGPVFVVDQKKPGNGHFDEHKAMIGWNTVVEAKLAYEQNYQRGWKGAEAIRELGIDQFKTWLMEGDTTQRASSGALQSEVYSHSNLNITEEVGHPGFDVTPELRTRALQGMALMSRRRPGDISWEDIDLVLHKAEGDRYVSEDGNYAMDPDGKGGYWLIAFGDVFGWGNMVRARALMKERYVADVDAGAVSQPESNDPLSGVAIDQKARVIRGWEKLAESPKAFLTRRSTSKDPQQIAKDMGLEGVVKVSALAENPFLSWFEIRLPDGTRATINYMPDWSARWQESRPKEAERKGPGAYLDAQGLRGQGYGRLAYQIALTWAHNNRVKLYPDPSGVTFINTFRRTEQMISAALKFGSTKYLEPHSDQRIDGWISDPESQEDEDNNLARLIMRSYKNVEQAMAGVAKFGEIRYNFKSLRFEDASGNKITAKDFDELSGIVRAVAKNAPSSDTGIGRTTLARAAFTRSLLEGGVGVDRFLDEAVSAGSLLTTDVQESLALYSRRRGAGGGQAAGPGGQGPAASGSPVAGAPGSTPLRRVRMPKWAANEPHEVQAALVKAGVITTETTWRERVHELTTGWRTRFKQAVFDQFAPIRLIDDTAYMMARMSRSADTALEALLLYGRPWLDNGAVNIVVSEERAAKLAPKRRLNPFFIRSSDHTSARRCWCADGGLNPFFIRSSDHTRLNGGL